MVGRGPAREARGRGGSRVEAVGEDVARAGLAGRDRLPGPCGADAVPREARLRLSSGSAARRASATPGRSPTTSRRGRRGEPERRRGPVRATGTSKGGSTRRCRASYLASPPLVVAYALAGRIDLDLTTEPLGEGDDGPVFLRDLWPSPAEVAEVIAEAVSEDQFVQQYARIWDGDERWTALPTPTGPAYEWDPDSTYVREPPFFQKASADPVGSGSRGFPHRGRPDPRRRSATPSRPTTSRPRARSGRLARGPVPPRARG